MRCRCNSTSIGRATRACEVVYTREEGHDTPEAAGDEKIEPEESVVRVLVQISAPRRHLVRYYGAYSNRARSQGRKAESQLGAQPSSEVSYEFSRVSCVT